MVVDEGGGGCGKKGGLEERNGGNCVRDFPVGNYRSF